jgi:hypothetical protein
MSSSLSIAPAVAGATAAIISFGKYLNSACRQLFQTILLDSQIYFAESVTHWLIKTAMEVSMEQLLWCTAQPSTPPRLVQTSTSARDVLNLNAQCLYVRENAGHSVAFISFKEQLGLDVHRHILNVWFQDQTDPHLHDPFVHPRTSLTCVEGVVRECWKFSGFDARTRFSLVDNKRLQHLTRCCNRHGHRCLQRLRH